MTSRTFIVMSFSRLRGLVLLKVRWLLWTLSTFLRLSHSGTLLKFICLMTHLFRRQLRSNLCRRMKRKGKRAPTWQNWLSKSTPIWCSLMWTTQPLTLLLEVRMPSRWTWHRPYRRLVNFPLHPLQVPRAQPYDSAKLLAAICLPYPSPPPPSFFEFAKFYVLKLYLPSVLNGILITKCMYTRLSSFHLILKFNFQKNSLVLMVGIYLCRQTF